MRRLRCDSNGVTIVEFALVAPIFLLLIAGGLELGYSAYLRTLLEGEMQRASRDRTLEDAGSQRSLIEDRVRAMVRRLAPQADVTFERRAFRSYAEVSAPYEPFKDMNNNGRCDAQETYEDLNRNNQWDTDVGSGDSDGEARDVVIYTATVRHSRIIPISLNPFQGSTDIVARTAFRNQPFAQQASTIERKCL